MGVKNRILIAVLAAAMLTGLSCAEKNGPMEKAGRAVDKAAAKTVDAVGKATEKTGEALEKAGDKMQKKSDGEESSTK